VPPTFFPLDPAAWGGCTTTPLSPTLHCACGLGKARVSHMILRK
jgi:hypothetical protein